MDNKWTAIPAKRSRRQDANLRAMIVIGLLLLCALLGVVSFLAWTASGDSTEATYQPPTGSAAAEAAASAYLAGAPTDAPLAVSERDPYLPPTAPLGNGGGPWPHAVTVEDSGSGPTVEFHEFLFIDQGVVHTLTVPVVIQDEGVATIAGTPAVGPYTVPEEGDTLELPGNPAAAAPAVVDVISRWAAAYYSGDPVGLANSTGDQTGAVQGLGGWTVRDLNVPEYASSVTGPHTHVARVRVEVARDGSDAVTTQVLDLAVDESGTVPQVSGWGPVGTHR